MAFRILRRKSKDTKQPLLINVTIDLVKTEREKVIAEIDETTALPDEATIKLVDRTTTSGYDYISKADRLANLEETLAQMDATIAELTKSL